MTPPWVAALDLDENCRPGWTDGIEPVCSEECPAHDGKRCELTGFRPDRHCEPAVRAMGEALRKAR